MVELLLRTTWHFNHADKPSSLFSRSYCWAQELCGLHDDSHSAGPPYWHCCPSGCRWGWGGASWSTRPLRRLHPAGRRGGRRGWRQLPAPRRHLQAKQSHHSPMSDSRVWRGFVLFFYVTYHYCHICIFLILDLVKEPQTANHANNFRCDRSASAHLHFRSGKDVQPTANLWSCSHINLTSANVNTYKKETSLLSEHFGKTKFTY